MDITEVGIEIIKIKVKHKEWQIEAKPLPTHRVGPKKK